MSSDLIALVFALALGAAVVIVGLRRDLSETTRNGLPRVGERPERATATLGLYEGEETRRRQLSPRQRRWMIWVYLLMSLTYAAYAGLSADDRLLHAGMAGLWALGAMAVLRQGSSRASDF